MQFAELLKKHIVVIITVVLTVAFTVTLLLMLSNARGEFQESLRKVEEMKNDENTISRARFGLTRLNLDVATDNAKQATEQFDSLLSKLDTQFKAPETWPTDPIRLKDTISSKCDLFARRLEVRGVLTNLKDFTFGKWIGGGHIPRAEEIALLEQNLGIVEELISLIADSDVKSLAELSRGRGNDTLAMEERELYNFMRYRVKVTGNIVQIRQLLNSLNSSRMLFIVQKMTIESEDLVAKLAYPAARSTTSPTDSPQPGGFDQNNELPPMPGPGGKWGGKSAGGLGTQSAKTPPVANVKAEPLSLDERVIYRELTPLTMVLTIDYVEFKTPNSEEGK